jgi:hypothetical protein
MSSALEGERNIVKWNEGRMDEVWLQDTGAAMTNDVAKAKGMTA